MSDKKFFSSLWEVEDFYSFWEYLRGEKPEVISSFKKISWFKDAIFDLLEWINSVNWVKFWLHRFFESLQIWMSTTNIYLLSDSHKFDPIVITSFDWLAWNPLKLDINDLKVKYEFWSLVFSFWWMTFSLSQKVLEEIISLWTFNLNVIKDNNYKLFNKIVDEK